MLKTVEAWTTLVRLIGTKPLSACILLFPWYTCVTGIHENMGSEDELAPFTKLQTFLLFFRPIRSDKSAFQTAVERSKEIDHVVFYM